VEVREKVGRTVGEGVMVERKVARVVEAILLRRRNEKKHPKREKIEREQRKSLVR